jgi:hypothetical protein
MWRLTAINILAVARLARQATSLVAQSIQLARRELRLVLEGAELAILARAAEMEVVTHLFASLLHAGFEVCGALGVFRGKGQIEALLGFIIISILFVFVFVVCLAGEDFFGCD